MQHTAKDKPKIVRKCTLPLTSVRSIDLLVTELAVIAFPEGRATLLETAPGVSVGQVVEATEAELVTSGDISEMRLQPLFRPSRRRDQRRRAAVHFQQSAQRTGR
jgi:acetate CoA/acetoacetate CoA-transferase beta subunit